MPCKTGQLPCYNLASPTSPLDVQVKFQPGNEKQKNEREKIIHSQGTLKNLEIIF